MMRFSLPLMRDAGDGAALCCHHFSLLPAACYSAASNPALPLLIFAVILR